MRWKWTIFQMKEQDKISEEEQNEVETADLLKK